jgi:anti-sigma B factor antagonist
MFEIILTLEKEIKLIGRFDALQKEKALQIFSTIQKTSMVDFQQLDYISSAGLSVLLATQKRLKNHGEQLILKNMSQHVREIFRYAGFDMIFEIKTTIEQG